MSRLKAATAAVLLAATAVRAEYTPVYGPPVKTKPADSDAHFVGSLPFDIPGFTYRFGSDDFGGYFPLLEQTPAVGDGAAFGAALQIADRLPKGPRVYRVTPAGTAVVSSVVPSIVSDAYLFPRPVFGGANAAGAMAGASHFEGSPTADAARWSPGDTSPTRLAGLTSVYRDNAGGFGHAINAGGTVVGYAYTYVGPVTQQRRPVRWDAGQTAATELGGLGDSLDGQARAVNARGTAVGTIGTRPVRWEAGTTAAVPMDLPTNGLKTNSGVATAINDTGTAVGHVSTTSGYRPVRWDAGGTAVTVLGGLGTSSTGYTNGTVAMINTTGVAVGVVDKYTSTGFNVGSRAVRWDAGETAAVELAPLPSAPSIYNSVAYAVSTDGFIAGYSYVLNKPLADTYRRAVVWDAAGVPLDLNTLIDPASGWTLEIATAISDTHWVSGYGTYSNGVSGTVRQFLIQIPEPTTLALLGPAALLLRRRGRAGTA